MALGVKVWRAQGARAFFGRLVDVRLWLPKVWSGHGLAAHDEEYQLWLAQNAPSPEDLERMRATSATWRRRPLISIVVPVYNPQAEWLRSALQSVVDQAYTNWELAIADDASTRPYVRPILQEFAARDDRVKLVFREQNGNISAASNSALKVATGEFVGFLDHDDLLSPDALYEVAAYINSDPEADVVYSDEDKLLARGRRWRPFFKPDWSPDLLLRTNYICHFAVIRRSLVESIGGLRLGYEGAQDYDLILRATENARHVGHVAKPLYTWSQVKGSMALSA